MNSEVAIEQPQSLSQNKVNFYSYFISHVSKFFYFIIFVLVLYGWLQKENSNLSPENGLGYILGIIGGSLMLLLLLYPLRKKARFMHHIGQVKHWFKMHMLFGVLGPLAILFHANFALGSVNGSIAMLSMVLVATSGLIGRYFYSRLHFGLYGRKANLQELRDTLLISKGQIGSDIKLSKSTALLIKQAERKTLKKRNFIKSILIWPYVKLKIFLIPLPKREMILPLTGRIISFFVNEQTDEILFEFIVL